VDSCGFLLINNISKLVLCCGMLCEISCEGTKKSSPPTVGTKDSFPPTVPQEKKTRSWDGNDWILSVTTTEQKWMDGCLLGFVSIRFDSICSDGRFFPKEKKMGVESFDGYSLSLPSQKNSKNLTILCMLHPQGCRTKRSRRSIRCPYPRLLSEIINFCFVCFDRIYKN